MFQSNLHWALAGAGRGGGRGSSGSLGKQGLASKLIGTVLSSWAGLLNSHLCCSGCRSLLICTERQTDFLYIHHFLNRHFNAQSCSNRARPCSNNKKKKTPLGISLRSQIISLLLNCTTKNYPIIAAYTDTPHH